MTFLWTDLTQVFKSARKRNYLLRSQSGTSLIESIVALGLLSVLALTVTYSTIYASTFAKRSIRHSLATQLAQSKLEEYSAIDPSGLSSADSTSESNLVLDNVAFQRSISVTVNDDESRTVVVTVVPANASLGSSVTLEGTFALWGNT